MSNRYIFCAIFFLLIFSYSALGDYPATIVAVKDGDTLVMDIDLGFDIILKNQSVRLNNFDAWETSKRRKAKKISDEEISKGKVAREALDKLIESGKIITVEPQKPLRDVYGRLLLNVFIDGISVGDTMRKNGHERKDLDGKD